MSNIEDIKRCKKLTEPQNANWIGISNQLAIVHLIERIKELEEENKRKDMFVEMAKEVIENSILKQKVKYKINELKERIKKLKAHKKDKRSVNYINAEYLLDRIEKSLLEEK